MHAAAWKQIFCMWRSQYRRYAEKIKGVRGKNPVKKQPTATGSEKICTPTRCYIARLAYPSGKLRMVVSGSG